jgi:hypothetical protein
MLGVGAGIGIQASAGFSFQVSNAPTIYSLSNAFANSSTNVGAGLGVSVDYFAGFGENGQPVTGGGFTIGLAPGCQHRSQ